MSDESSQIIENTLKRSYVITEEYDDCMYDDNNDGDDFSSPGKKFKTQHDNESTTIVDKNLLSLCDSWDTFNLSVKHRKNSNNRLLYSNVKTVGVVSCAPLERRERIYICKTDDELFELACKAYVKTYTENVDLDVYDAVTELSFRNSNKLLCMPLVKYLVHDYNNYPVISTNYIRILISQERYDALATKYNVSCSEIISMLKDPVIELSKTSRPAHRYLFINYASTLATLLIYKLNKTPSEHVGNLLLGITVDPLW